MRGARREGAGHVWARAGGRTPLTSAVPAVRDPQLRVLALGTLELTTGQKGPSVRRTERLLGGPPAVQAAVFVLVLIDSQKLQEGKKKRRSQTDLRTRSAERQSQAAPRGHLAWGWGPQAAAAGQPLRGQSHRPRHRPGDWQPPHLGCTLAGGRRAPCVVQRAGAPLP